MSDINNAFRMDQDIYSGFDEVNDLSMLQNEDVFQEAVKTSYGQRRGPLVVPQTRGGAGFGAKTAAKPPTTALRGVLGSRRGTAVRGPEEGGGIRPISAINAAGFTPNAVNRSATGAAAFRSGTTEAKLEETPEAAIKKMEKEIMDLIDESSFALESRQHKVALEKANKAVTKEKILQRHRDLQGFSEQTYLDLTYSVYFNSGNVFEACEMYQEAQTAYMAIIKNKAFSSAGRFRVNLGNILLKQGKHVEAIRMYRRALDQIPETHTHMRIKILKNIGVTFIKMNPPQYSDAIVSFEHIMKTKPDFKTAFNLDLCYYAIGDQDKMKKSFHRLLTVPMEGIEDDDRYLQYGDDPHSSLVLEAIKDDELRKIEQNKKRLAEKSIIQAAKLIAPVVEGTEALGFDWCVDCVRESQHTELASELEINKAIMYLKLKDFQKAVEALKVFEKKNSKIASTAANNLSFLYFLKGESKEAEKYADQAIESDRYNPYALVNRGNIHYKAGELEKARDYYQESLSIESGCAEALYNLGLTFKTMGNLENSLECFEKLHAILNNCPEVIYQIASLYDMKSDIQQSVDWFMHLITIVPTDPGILAQIGAIYDQDNDRSQAFQYFLESHKYFPSDISTISWLGAFYIDGQFHEKAIQYFERASLIEPQEVKWQLMIASCYRRSGNYQQSLATYKKIHMRFPDNVECLKFLVRICTDLGLKELQEYANKLKKAEKAKELRDQRRENSGRKSGRQRNSGGSERSNSGTRAPSGRQNSGRQNSGRRADQEVALRDSGSGKKKPVDATYSDPIGDLPPRPRTSAKTRVVEDDDFGDEELGDDMLPE